MHPARKIESRLTGKVDDGGPGPVGQFGWSFRQAGLDKIRRAVSFSRASIASPYSFLIDTHSET